MENPFENLDKNPLVKIPLQEKKGGNVSRKKRGRPQRPNMVKKTIKVDVVLYQQISQKAEEENTTIAALLARAMKRELNDPQ